MADGRKTRAKGSQLARFVGLQGQDILFGNGCVQGNYDETVALDERVYNPRGQ
jgi:hypothetical protein